MKRTFTLLTIALALCGVSPAFAAHYDQNNAAVGMLAEKAMTVIPPASLLAVKLSVDADYTPVGPFRRCEVTKAMIEIAVANFNQ